jgi:hypothetical protein
MPYFVNNAKHWRECAAETRAVAGQLPDSVARENMLEVARAYDRMAGRRRRPSDHNDSRKDSA